jgi:curved DNA-binding protein CbpA
VGPHDYYRLLGVEPEASYDAIHVAYRALARRFHPDASGEETTMKLLNVAWDALRHADRRAAYDTDRRAGSQAEPIVEAPSSGDLHPDHAGPPPGDGFGSVLSYGRYEGWSLAEIAREDPAYLEWLRRIPTGRPLRREIDDVFEELRNRPLTLGGRRVRR